VALSIAVEGDGGTITLPLSYTYTWVPNEAGG
jgi:hypothetical protein